MSKLQDYIEKSPLVLAAITEATHRFYHDRILSDKQQDINDLAETDCSNILTMLWNLNPNWRHVLKESMKRYDSADTNSVPTCSKPKEGVYIAINIEIKHPQ